MSTLTLLLILFSSVGFLISGFFSLYLLFIKKHRALLDLLLGGLLLALSIRIGKSVFYNFTELPIAIKNLGLAANLAIGPFLWLYGKVAIDKSALRKHDYLHFIPAGVYIVFCGLIPNQISSVHWQTSYGFVIFQQLCYLAVSTMLINSWEESWRDGGHKSFLILWGAIGIIWLTYLLIYIELIPAYIFGALAYSLLAILLAFFALEEGWLLSPREKYGPQRLSSIQSQRYLELVQAKLEADQAFLNPNLNIQDFSHQVSLPAKVISQVINDQLKLNFSAFINSYRIAEAQRRLSSDTYTPFTIASIAYDCGFNSISSFNTTFKLLTKQTPSAYRKSFRKTTA